MQNNGLRSVGITCALCHSTVDDSLTAGIGRRLDGWANRDLDVDQIVALAPDLSAFATLLGISQDAVRQALRAWGPGKFDAELVLDGKAFRQDGKTAATLIPPAFGLAGVVLARISGVARRRCGCALVLYAAHASAAIVAASDCKCSGKTSPKQIQ